jgi:hypothetical protein
VVPEENQCQECYGSGKSEEDCDACIDGYVDCPHCGNDTECSECKGDGVVQSDEPCEECDGKGKTFSFDGVKVPLGVANIGGNYHKLIASLPGILHCVPTDPNGVIPFRFDGGEGILCPLPSESAAS